ncbi:FtsX-like permease family protein [Nakamurella lactea]|uniref:FtsX-like permease family protein n=1 Tax=Nakamurella lactea TaxID=459515 RepID=UPI0003FE6CC5|nr:FtsX-like permease family protein [Nakamurella lactea]
MTKDLWWRLASRLFVGRSSVVTAVLVALPLAATVAGVAAAQSVASTREQVVQLMTGGHAASISVGDGAIPDDLATRLGPDMKVATIRTEIYDVPATAHGAGAEVIYRETHWGAVQSDELYRVIAGRLPNSPRHAAVSVELAEQLQLTPGSEVVVASDPAHPVAITGVVEPLRRTDELTILGEAGTWRSLQVPSMIRSSLFPTRDVLVDPRKPDGAVSIKDPRAVVADATAAFAGDPFYVQQPTLVAIPVVILAVVGAAFGLVVRLRRTRADFAVLSAFGLRRRGIRSLIVLGALLVAVPAAVVGVGIGAALAPMLTAALAAALKRGVVTQHGISVTATITMAGLAVATTVVVAWLVSARVARDADQGAGARPASDNVPVRGRRGWIRRTIQALAIVGSAISVATLRDDMTGAFLAIGSFIVLLISSAPDLVAVLHRILRRLGIPADIGGVLVVRDQGRTLVTVAAVLTGLCLPIGVAASGQSLNRQQQLLHVANPPAGQVRINSHGHALPPETVRAIGAAAGQEPVALRCLTSSPDGSCWQPAIGEDSREITVIDDPSDLSKLTGLSASPEDAAALSRGELLVLGSAPGGGSTTLTGPSAGDHRHITFRRRQADDSARQVTTAVLLTSALPTGTTAKVLDYRIPAAANRFVEIRSAAMAQGMLSRDVSVDTPPTNRLGGTTDFLVRAGGVLALLLAATAMVAAARENCRTYRQLAALGMSAAAVTLTGLLSSVIPIAVGWVFGVAGGLFIAWVRLIPVDMPLAVPWTTVGWATVGLALLVAIAFLARPRAADGFLSLS